MNSFPTLYSRTSTGAAQQWNIELSKDQDCYRTSYGQVGGKITTSEWTTVQSTNIGRSNQRDVVAQTLFQASAIWKKKKDSGYFENLADIDTHVFLEPMLAKKWEDCQNKINYPVFSQPKLDGLRCIIDKNGATSRNGKPWLTIAHIVDALAPIFESFPDLVLDGELYNHEYKEDFNEICSLVKRTKPSQQDLQRSRDKVQFWCYDCFGDVFADKSFADRSLCLQSLLQTYCPDYTVHVDTVHVLDQEMLDQLYGDYLTDGYEGQMIRLDAPYENKRSSNLLKRKTFQDSEYLIVDICEGNGNKTGMAGYAVLQSADGTQFNSNIKGNHSFLKGLLRDRENFIGCYATCKYFNLTPAGIPRFPYLIGFRDTNKND